MPVFKFTSPDNVDYYGEGASPEDAFRTATERDPSEIAAMRTRQSVRHGVETPEPEIPEAARAVQRGEFGPLREAAGESAAALGGAVAPVASLLGRAVAPTATAEESKFPFIDDPKERQSADVAYANIKEYSEDKKTGRKVFDREKTQVAKNTFMAEQQKIARGRGEELASQTNWEEKQKPAVEKLSPEEKAIYESISVPGNPGQTRQQKGEFLREVAEQRKRLTMTWAEKHPEAMEDIQVGAALVSGVAPIYQAWRRASGLSKSAREAEAAFDKAMKAKAPKSAKESMALKANIAEELDKIDDPGFIKAIAKSALIGTGFSWFAPQAPNLVDWARLPEGSEAKAKARAAVFDPENLGRAAIEGGAAGFAGRGAAEKFGSLPAARARNRAALQTIRDKQAAEVEAAQKRGVRKAPAIENQQWNPAAKPDVLAPGGGGPLAPGGNDAVWDRLNRIME